MGKFFTALKRGFQAASERQPGTTAGQTTQRAQLGCGTLILIALIVLVFSGRGEVEDVGQEVRAVRRQVTEVRQQLTRLEAKTDSLRAELDSLLAAK